MYAEHGNVYGLIMRPPAPWHYALWLLVGALGGLGVLSLLTIGPILLLAAGAVTVLCTVLRLLNRSVTALPAGLAVPVLYLAWLNRGGPGDVCDPNGCTGEWSPWPFVAVGVILVGASVFLWSKYPRVVAALFPGAATPPPAA